MRPGNEDGREVRGGPCFDWKHHCGAHRNCHGRPERLEVLARRRTGKINEVELAELVVLVVVVVIVVIVVRVVGVGLLAVLVLFFMVIVVVVVGVVLLFG